MLSPWLGQRMQFGQVKRREFITLLGRATAAWSGAAGAQQGERVRRIGVLVSLAANDAQGQARRAAFLQGLQQLGWIDARNVRIDTRWGAGDADRTRRYAAELVAPAPDCRGRHQANPGNCDKDAERKVRKNHGQDSVSRTVACRISNRIDHRW